MKNIIEKHAKTAASVFGIMIGLIIVLSVYVFCDIRNDNVRDRSFRSFFETEMYSSADRLYNELNCDNYTAAYHYSRSAEEYASRAERKNEAHLFAEIASEIENNGTVGEKIREELFEYLSNGRIFENNVTVKKSAEYVAGDENENGMHNQISKYRINSAESTVSAVIGVDNILHLCEKNIPNEFLFTCRNAYAVIDSSTGRPLEYMLSMKGSETAIKIDEGIARAYELLGMFYPKASVESAVVESTTVDKNGEIYDIEFLVEGVSILVSVKRDSGKVISVVAR